MDYSTFTELTGVPKGNERFFFLRDLAAEQLAELLGWPLNPASWDNQYIEIGKTKDNWFCSDVDTSDLLPADTVQGKTRLFTWDEDDEYLAIDPVLKVYSIKLVKDGITYYTFNPADYRVQWINGQKTYGRYVQLSAQTFPREFWPYLVWRSDLAHDRGSYNLQVAIDADWGFGDLPQPLKRVWAEQIAYEMDLKRDVKSESMFSHSYSKTTRRPATELYADTIAKYVGPHGTAYSPEILV